MTRKTITSIVLLILVVVGGTTYFLIDYRNQQNFQSSLKAKDSRELEQAAEAVNLSTKERNRYIQQFQKSIEYEKALVLLNETSAKNQINWFYAAQFAPTEVVASWLDAGSSVKQVNKQGQNVLHVATSVNRSVDAYALLLKNATKNQINQQDQSKHTPLYYATINQNKKAMELLLQAGASPDEGANPPIYETVKQNRKDLYQLLKTSGATPDEKKVKTLAKNYGAEAFQ